MLNHRTSSHGASVVLRLLAGVCSAGALLGQTNTTLLQIADAGRLEALRWSDFSDYRQYVKGFYEPGGYALAWIRAGKPTPQALGVIGILQKAEEKGLRAEDYDGPQWSERLLPTALMQARSWMP